ncbi:MAG: hypothetical protein ACI4OR_02270 [Alphaproteobacteria bacterium]
MSLNNRLNQISGEEKDTPKSIREMLKKGRPLDEWLKEHYSWMYEAGEKINKKNEKTDKKGFHNRFHQIDETTIEETNEFGQTRQFHLNKENGTWEVKTNGHPEKVELTLVGKDLFNVTETDKGSYETILYSPAKKVQEMFVRGENGKYFLCERVAEDVNGIRDRQMFDENHQLIEQRVSDKGAWKKLVRNGKVLFDATKTASLKLSKHKENER